MSHEEKYNFSVKKEVNIEFLLNSIPQYDGYNTPFSKFAIYTRYAYNTVSDDLKPLFLGHVTQRLTSKAGREFVAKIFNYIDDLLESLRQCYESESSVSNLFSQLLNIKQSNARDLGSKLMMIKDQLAIAVANEGIKTPAALIEKISLTKYISSLTSNVKVLTKAKVPSTLSKAVEIAIE